MPFIAIPFRRLVWAVLFLLFAWAGVGHAGEIQGRVVEILDGDTLTLLDDANRQHRIRLAQIDAPEQDQAFGRRARDHLAALAFGRRIQVEVVDTEVYGRIVGILWEGGRDLNKEMVRSGYAWVYTRYARDPKLRVVEDEARRNARGLWAGQNPIPPWEYRREHRS